MRNAFRIPALVVALSMTSSVSYGFDLCRLLGLGCGDACGCSAGCGCEVSCGCERTCGCGDSCGCDGRQFGGEVWNCCDECGPPICPCTGPECCDAEPACGCACGDACGCADGCEPACGCGSSCGCGNGGCALGCGFGQCCGRLIGMINKCCGCTGCDGELYWSEWHNDPPRCCDPCDHCGNWVGPSYGYRAPYHHPYSTDGYVDGAYYARGEAATRSTPVARESRPATTKSAARPTFVGQQMKQAAPAGRSVRPITRGHVPARGQVTRKPNVGPNSTYQR